MLSEVYEFQRERYASGDNLPWDDVLPPPEVRALVDSLSTGRALDIGCGYGRSSIYLAQHGWEVDGVDFVQAAVEEARRRADVAKVSPTFHRGDVTDLGFLDGPYDLAIDVGCAHAFESAEIRKHIHELTRLLKPTANYLLYARLQETDVEQGESVARGLNESALLTLLEPNFQIQAIQYGERLDFHAPWKSAWLHFIRK